MYRAYNATYLTETTLALERDVDTQNNPETAAVSLTRSMAQFLSSDLTGGSLRKLLKFLDSVGHLVTG